MFIDKLAAITIGAGALVITAGAGFAAAHADAQRAEARASSYDLRAWALYDHGEAEARTAGHRLIGFACGDDRLTLTAREESDFPTCEAIETIEDACPEDMTTPPEPVTAAECARYMGDGW